MKFKIITSVVVSVLLVIIISSAAIIPIVQVAQEEQKTTGNNASQLFSVALGSSDDVDVAIIDNEYYINGVKYSGSLTGIATNAKFWGENFSARMYPGTQIRFEIVFDDGVSSTHDVRASAISYHNGVITFTDYQTQTEYTVSSDFFIYISEKGDYAEYSMTNQQVRDSVSINNDATIFIGSNAKTYALVRGTVDSLNYVGDFTYYGTDSTSYVYDSISITSVASDDGLTYKVGSTPTMNLIQVSDDTSVPITTLLVYVPIEYDYISDSDSATISMLAIIPTLIFVIPIMLIVRSFAMGRD